jgi:steroid delta-isomerase-like uncharacterized protein
MYGTIAKIQIDPAKIEALKALGRRMGVAPGQLGRYVYQMDVDPGELFLVALFESQAAYWANAQSPEQHARFQELRALLAGDPEWHDGAIIDAVLPTTAATERNAAIVRRTFDEIINQEDKAVIDEVYAADVIIHDPFTGMTQGTAAMHNLLGLFDAAFPHHRVTVEAIVSQGDLVSVLHTHTATNTGAFLGMPPTGKTVVVNGVELFRLRDGKIVEFWRKDDDVSLLMQLGMLPMPQPAA